MDTFDVTSGELIVSDPCFLPYTGDLQLRFPARCGTWTFVADREPRAWAPTRAILAYWGDQPPPTETNEGEISVDSGMVGIFDAHRFGVSHGLPEITPITGVGLFYDHCCRIGLDRVDSGVMDGGCVASTHQSGLILAVQTARDQGEVIAVSIVLM